MAPSRKMKIISGTAVAAVALGASTAIAQSGSGTHEVNLDDVVPISEVAAPEAGTLDIADLALQLDDGQDSLASPFDTSDQDEDVALAEESPASIDTFQSVESAEDTVDDAESPVSTDTAEDADETQDSPDSLDTDQSPDSLDTDESPASLDTEETPDSPDDDSPDSADSED